MSAEHVAEHEAQVAGPRVLGVDFFHAFTSRVLICLKNFIAVIFEEIFWFEICKDLIL